jgi:glucokinase-like ROK family protein
MKWGGSLRMETGDQYLVKKINKTYVLETIKKYDPISRIEIAVKTGLNKGTVSSLVSELIKENIIQELGPGLSSGGRKPILLRFNNKAGFSIGIDIGVNYILVVLTDLNGNIVNKEHHKIVDDSFDQVMSLMIDVIRRLIDNAPDSPYGIVGIGIGVAGIVNVDGEVLFAPNLDWSNVNIKEPLKKEFNLPVLVDNEANAGVIGEKQFGAGKDTSNLLYLSVGIGIGAGIIIDGQLFRGSSAFSGEVGHFSIEPHGLECPCGNKGCWELYASEKALLSKAQQLFSDHKNMNIDQLVELADNGNTQAIDLISTIGEYLGIGLSNLINTFNPDTILIGNRISKIKRWLETPINKTIHDRALPYHLKHLKIAFSDLHLHSAALGASSFAIDHFFTALKN